MFSAKPELVCLECRLCATKRVCVGLDFGYGCRLSEPKVWAAFPESEWCNSGRLRGLGFVRRLAQEGVQYVSHQQTGGEEARQGERRRWAAFGRSFVKRKLGLSVGKDVAPPPPKRRRTKSFVTMMQVENILRGSVGASLSDFQVRPGPSGELADPFTWRSLNMALDMGADMVCMVHNLCYEKQVNLSADWDLARSSSNAAKNNALKACKIWAHQVLMPAASNCVYGSTLSPPRLHQIRECVEEYFGTCTPDDPYFQ